MVPSYPDFYNDVFGPIMQPFSSSHTAAPCKIGYLANCVLGEPVKDVTIAIPPGGTFWGAFKMHFAELALLSGSAGHLPDNKIQFSIKEYYRDNGIAWRFVEEPVPETTHHSSAKITLVGQSGKTSFLVGNSIGGGVIETTCINGYPFKASGDAWMVLLFDPQGALDFDGASAKLDAKLTCIDRGSVRQDGLGTMHWYNSSDPVTVEEVRAITGWNNTSVLLPVMAVTTNKDRKPQLFGSFREWKTLCKQTGKGLAELAIQYEMDYACQSREEVVAYMRDVVWKKMHRTTHAVLEDPSIAPKESPYKTLTFDIWSDYANSDKGYVDGTIARAITCAWAAMTPVPGIEFVPAPMGAGGGLLYSSLCAVREARGFSDEDLLRGLFVAAGVGAICFTLTEPGGGNIGCAGEQGISSCMAAAAIVEMAGGTPDQVEAAASNAMQVATGWPCDPTAGCNDQPCCARALTGVCNAIVFSQLALCGRTSVFPLDEAIAVADKVGRAGCAERARCGGSWAYNAAPTARTVTKEFKAWSDEQDRLEEQAAR